MATASGEHPTDPPDDLATVAWGPVSLVLVVLAALLVATSARYGYHRDELYYLESGHHLAWGYTDQGPLSPLLARAFDELGRGSLTVFRIPAMMAALASGLFGALAARELGGRTFAQVLAVTLVGGGLFTLGAGHLVVTATFDFLVWVAIAFLVLRLLRTGEDRWWLVIGVVAGIGLLNKALPAVLILGIAVGLVLVPSARRHLRSPWLWIGGLVALALWSPYLIWQAKNGWPQLTISREIHAEYSQAGERIGFGGLQFVLFGVAGGAVWIIGLVQLLRRPEWRTYRVLVVVWLVALVVFVVTAGQGYYTAGTYPAMIAAGAVTIERWTHRRVLVMVVAVVTALVMVPAFLPVLPARVIADTPPWSGLAENQLETVGWPDLVDQVTAAYTSLPPDQQAAATILTSNYGEAGAIDRYGAAHGLPTAYSGHNAFADWGPPPADKTVVVSVSEDGPPRQLTDCRLFAKVDNAEHIPNEESDDASIYLCRAPRQGWTAAWPQIAHLSS